DEGASTPRLHGGDDRAKEAHGREEVQLPLLLPDLVRREDVARLRAAGVRHGDVDSPELLGEPRHRLVVRDGIGDVSRLDLHGDTELAKLVGRLLEALASSGDQPQGTSFFGEAPSDGSADPLRATRDDGDLPAELQVHSPTIADSGARLYQTRSSVRPCAGAVSPASRRSPEARR